MESGLYIYHLFVWSNLNFLHNSQWVTLPIQSCLVLYSLWANLLHSLIMCFIVSSLSPRNLHLLFCYALSSLALTWSFMALFCAAIRRDAVCLFRFPFLSHGQVFLYGISLVCCLKCPCNCFLSHFCFLVIFVFVLLMLVLSVLFLVAVISACKCWSQNALAGINR